MGQAPGCRHGGSAALADPTAKRVVKDFPATAKTDAELGFDKPTAVISLWTDGVKKEDKPADEAKKEEPKDAAKKDEPKKDEVKKDGDKKEPEKDAKKPESQQPALKDPKPTIKLTFGKRDKDLVYVKREAGSAWPAWISGLGAGQASEACLFRQTLPGQTISGRCGQRC